VLNKVLQKSEYEEKWRKKTLYLLVSGREERTPSFKKNPEPCIFQEY